ncbi:hypothetical protein C8A05DRAFT_38714, partial [Staphylotrichum tortipilum]
MKTSNSALLAAGIFAQYASLATAHSIFQQASAGSTDFGTTCVRMPPNNSPVTSVTSADMACNVGGAKGVEGFCEVK